MGGLAESGVRATCFGGFTIVYRHRSTEWPVPYTDSHTPGAHEVIERAKELRPDRKKEGEKKKGNERGYNRRRQRDSAEKRLTYGQGRQTEVHFHSLRQVHSYYNDGRTAFLCSLARSPACPLSCQTHRLTGFSFSVPRTKAARSSQSPSDIRLQTSLPL